MAVPASRCTRARALDRDGGRCVPLGWLRDRSARGPHRRRSVPDRLGVLSLALWASASRARLDAGGTGCARGVVVSGGDHGWCWSGALVAAVSAAFFGALT